VSGGEKVYSADVVDTMRRDLRHARQRIADLESERDTMKASVAAANASVSERVANAMMMRDRAADATLRQRIADLSGETAFLAQRVAWHLEHGCDTAKKARELALAEWGVGVVGGGG
jgi:hypothetical protein